MKYTFKTIRQIWGFDFFVGSVEKFVYEEYRVALELDLGNTTRIKRQCGISCRTYSLNIFSSFRFHAESKNDWSAPSFVVVGYHQISNFLRRIDVRYAVHRLQTLAHLFHRTLDRVRGADCRTDVRYL